MAAVSRRTLLGALALPVLGGTQTACLGPDWDDMPRARLTIATGNPGGVFTRYGDALAAVLDRRLTGVTATTRLTNASVENIRLVARGTCDIGFSLGDTAADAVRGTGGFGRPFPLTALVRTYDSFVHLVVRDDAAITGVSDLRGKRVGLGQVGSGTRVVALRVLAQAGLLPSDVEPWSQPLEQSAEALRARRLDAFFFVSGIPNDAVRELAQDTRIRLLELESLVVGMSKAYGPEYVAGPIPASTYGLRDAVDTVSVRNYVIARRNLPDDAAYAMTRVIFEAQAEIDKVAPGVRQPTLGAAIFTSPVDLHPGALRYYRERQP